MRPIPIIRAIVACMVAAPVALSAQSKPTIEQFMSPASPLDLVAAKKADRLAWMAYDRGMRNVYTAAAPEFRPVRLTRFLEDNGIDITNVSISDNGSVVVFVRGSAPNREGWVANPSHDPDGSAREIWAVRTAPGSAAFRIAEGGSPELSPDGRFVLYVKDNQIYRARVSQAVPVNDIDRGSKPFISAWGNNGSPRWSPDGSKIAFVSARTNHSFIGLYDVSTRTVTYVSPGVDFDALPTWSLDGKQIAFTRRPGLPFGRQGQGGAGAASLGNPAGPAAGGGSTGVCAAEGGQGGRGGGRFGGAPDSATAVDRAFPGLCRATFRGGYTLSIMVADIGAGAVDHVAESTREAREIWHNQPDDRVFTGINRMFWGDGHLVFPLSPVTDEWDRYWSVKLDGTTMQPVLLTTTDGLIEDATSAKLSPDGKILYYCTNANDIERRDIWAVPVAGGTPRQITSGDGIETYPQPLGSGREVGVLYFDARQPATVGLVSAGGGKARVIFPGLPKDFPTDAHVVPEVVRIKAPDGVEVPNQLFLPQDLKAGERRPALIFVHGGPARQMLPGYHYMQFWS
jgi:Tol biopolymer transport system component